MYQTVLDQPLSDRLQRLEQIEKEYKQFLGQAEELMQMKASIESEAEQKNSWSSVLGTFARSVWDGFTLGAFAEEGLFTEVNKIERWTQDIKNRDALRVSKAKIILSHMEALEKEDAQIRPTAQKESKRYRFCSIAKSWGLIIGVLSIIVALAFKFQSRKDTGVTA
jgi:hypothetical protein